MKKILSILISLVVICAVIIAVIFANRSKQIPDNPANTIGNLSGNLNNKGYFCENDGIIYFTNFADNHYLYKINSDGSDCTRLMDVPVAYINAGGDYLYFYYDDQGDAKFMGVAGNMHGIYRLRNDGKDDMECLDRCVSGIVNLVGSTIYYQHYDNVDGMTLYHSSLNGKDKGMSIKSIVNPSCVLYGEIYYPDTENNFYLNKFIPGSTSGTLFQSAQMYNPTAIGDYIYYMCVNDNYRLYRYNIKTGETEKITNDRIDTFNVYKDMIFYQRNNDPALIAVHSDGSNPLVVATGNYSDINCTSEYTYFHRFKEETMLRTPTYGADYYEEFRPASN